MWLPSFFFVDSNTPRLQNSCIFCEHERPTIFKRKVWSECKNGKGEWSRLTRFTLEDHVYGVSRLPKMTVLQFTVVLTWRKNFIFSKYCPSHLNSSFFVGFPRMVSYDWYGSITNNRKLGKL